jgi:hypothetical protein
MNCCISTECDGPFVYKHSPSKTPRHVITIAPSIVGKNSIAVMLLPFAHSYASLCEEKKKKRLGDAFP